jgi:exosome complex RNA-binding protein Rrp42 (RNase PH superfamily)
MYYLSPESLSLFNRLAVKHLMVPLSFVLIDEFVLADPCSADEDLADGTLNLS